MKIKKIMSILGILILVAVDVYAGGLAGITTKASSIQADILALLKVIAGLGLLFVLGSYLISTNDNKTFPWKWVIGALGLGAFAQILTMFGL